MQQSTVWYDNDEYLKGLAERGGAKQTVEEYSRAGRWRVVGAEQIDF